MAYSQNDEEQRILRYFGEEVGNVLDLGANDGRRFSNSLAVIERGWKAVLVEPSTRALARLKTLHASRIASGQVQVLPYAIANVSGRLVFHESGSLVGGGDVALVSTLSAAEAIRWSQSGVTYTRSEVDALTWPELYEKCDLRTFDLITIDVEAFDYWVLQQMDLTALKCRMLIVEDNQGHQPYFEEYCYGRGLHLVHRNAENLIFQR